MAVDGQDPHVGGGGLRQHRLDDDGSALRAAHLASPSFKEPWNDGSPLNWCEFIARCQGKPQTRGAGRRASVPLRIPER